MLVFSHIPRTGGTSIRHFVSTRVPRWKSIDALSDFAFMSDDELAGHDFLATHCGHAIFRRVTSARRLVILRDPVERVISQYYHLRALSEDVSYASHYAKTLSLEDYVLEKNPAVSVGVEDAQLWHLIADKNVAFRKHNEHLNDQQKIELAIENLSTYDFVGFQDTLDKVFDVLVDAFEWPDGDRPTLVPSNRPKMSAVKPELLDLIRRRVRLDLCFYSEARRRHGSPG